MSSHITLVCVCSEDGTETWAVSIFLSVLRILYPYILSELSLFKLVACFFSFIEQNWIFLQTNFMYLLNLKYLLLFLQRQLWTILLYWGIHTRVNKRNDKSTICLKIKFSVRHCYIFISIIITWNADVRQIICPNGSFFYISVAYITKAVFCIRETIEDLLLYW